jgi:hypothetical protein
MTENVESKIQSQPSVASEIGAAHGSRIRKHGGLGGRRRGADRDQLGPLEDELPATVHVPPPWCVHPAGSIGPTVNP